MPSSDEMKLTLKTLDLFPTMKVGKIMQFCFSTDTDQSKSLEFFIDECIFLLMKFLL